VTVDIWRVLDVLMGAAIGVVAVFVLPSRPKLAPAVSAVESYVAELGALLREIGAQAAADLPTVPSTVRQSFIGSSRSLRDTTLATREAFAVAVESTRFNLRRGDIDVDLGRLADALRWMDRLAIQSRSLAGSVDQLYHRPGIEPALPGRTWPGCSTRSRRWSMPATGTVRRPPPSATGWWWTCAGRSARSRRTSSPTR
jgi:hypothetical protein